MSAKVRQSSRELTDIISLTWVKNILFEITIRFVSGTNSVLLMLFVKRSAYMPERLLAEVNLLV